MSNAGESGRERLGHDQRPVVGDHHPVWEPEILRGDCGGAVGIDAHEAGARRRAAAHQVEAEVADERSSLAVDDHVVHVTADQVGQVGVGADAAVRTASQDSAVLHRDHEHVSVGQPAQARRLGLDL